MSHIRKAACPVDRAMSASTGQRENGHESETGVPAAGSTRVPKILRGELQREQPSVSRHDARQKP